MAATGLALWALLALLALAPPVWGQVAVGAVVSDDRGKAVAFSAPPQRIVSLLPSLTETVCALGACGRLVGTDQWSNWPASVAALPKLGGLETTQIERIVSLKPDLVLAAGSSRAIDRLESLGLRVLVLEPRSLADTRRVIGKVAVALGNEAAGAALWQQVQAHIGAAAARVPAGMRGQRVYFEVDPAPFAAGETSFVGELLGRLGMANVVPAALGPFPKLNPEFVVRAQPDVVMAAQPAIAEMGKRPGWAALRALRLQRVCGFDKASWDPLVRPGPRLAEAADTLAACLAGLPAPPP
jgi:iron complex transport system substrate-binding protein